jgi:uncharacterized membrane protein YjgN (DUF898 family)
MSATSPTPLSRPRVVNAAFGCWVAADVLTAALGLLLITSPAPMFIRAAGGLLIAVGLAHGFLAGRARGGNKRFEYAGVALSLASVALLALLLLFGASLIAIVIVATIMILTIAGSAMMQGKPAQAWFDGEDGS